MNESWLDHALTAFDNKNHEDGDLLSHDWIQWALQLPIPKTVEESQACQFVALHRFDSFRDYLLTEKKIALQNVRGAGYRIVPPKEQAHYASFSALSQVVKGLRKGAKIMTHTRTELLSDTEKKLHTDAEIRLAGIGQIMNNQRKDVFKLFKVGN